MNNEVISALRDWAKSGEKPSIPGVAFFAAKDRLTAHCGDDRATDKPIEVSVIHLMKPGELRQSSFIRYPADHCQYCGGEMNPNS